MRLLGYSNLLSLLLVCGLGWGGANADSDDDHERARRAFEAGEIVSLARVLEAVERNFDGQVLEVELEDEERRFVYEVKLLAPGGEILELLFDARDAALLRVEGRRHGRKDGGAAEEHDD